MPGTDTKSEIDQARYAAVLERGAIAEAFRGFLGDLLCEPVPLSKLAALYDVDRKTAARFVRQLDGAVQFGNLWRLPLKQLPPKYFLESGFIVPSD